MASDWPPAQRGRPGGGLQPLPRPAVPVSRGGPSSLPFSHFHLQTHCTRGRGQRSHFGGLGRSAGAGAPATRAARAMSALAILSSSCFAGPVSSSGLTACSLVLGGWTPKQPPLPFYLSRGGRAPADNAGSGLRHSMGAAAQAQAPAAAARHDAAVLLWQVAVLVLRSCVA